MFKVKDIDELKSKDLNAGFYILLTHVDKKPVHISVCLDGKLYTLTVKGKQLNENMHVLLKAIRIKSIKSLFFKIKIKPETIKADFETELFKAFQKYDLLIDRQATCLSPVKLFFNKIYGLECLEAKSIFEFFPFIYKSNLLEKVLHIHLGDELVNKEYVIEYYNEKDIYNRISTLSRQKTFPVCS